MYFNSKTFCVLQVSQLEGLVDGIIDKWKVVADKVVDAAKVSNVRLLAAQVCSSTLCMLVTAQKSLLEVCWGASR